MKEYFLIASHVHTSSLNVVELATGTGRMCAVLSGLFPFVITGDISLDDFPRAQERIPPQFKDSVCFIQLNMESLPFASNSLQTIFCMNTVHEVSNPLLCVDEMIRVLHPNGVLTVGDFNCRGFEMMQLVHKIVYHNNHNKGKLSINDVGGILSKRFLRCKTIETPLNSTIIATGKN